MTHLCNKSIPHITVPIRVSCKHQPTRYWEGHWGDSWKLIIILIRLPGIHLELVPGTHIEEAACAIIRATAEPEAIREEPDSIDVTSMSMICSYCPARNAQVPKPDSWVTWARDKHVWVCGADWETVQSTQRYMVWIHGLNKMYFCNLNCCSEWNAFAVHVELGIHFLSHRYRYHFFFLLKFW